MSESEATTLFDVFERTNMHKSKHAETGYSFYNNSAWPAVVKIRALLEEWFLAYPQEPRTAFLNRFRDANQHPSAFFELFLHELFLRIAGSVRVEAPCSWTTHKPDFLAPIEGSSGVIIEAVATTGLNHEENTGERYFARVYDALESVPSPDFLLTLRPKGQLATQPPIDEFVYSVQTWLGTLDYDECQYLCESKNSHKLPVRVLRHGEWNMEISVWPKIGSLRGRLDGLTLSGTSFGFRQEKVHEIIHKALDRKANMYKDEISPLVLAINLGRAFIDEESVLAALFGDVASEIRHDGRGNSISNGLIAKARHRSVSGVLVAWDCYPNSVARTRLMLYENPWASHPLADGIPGLARCITTFRGSQIICEKREGKESSELFGLPRDWPGPRYGDSDNPPEEDAPE
ncbi:MAG: hypothetical protein AAB152_18810 [Candidatus Coatesbacteria bacterium]